VLVAGASGFIGTELVEQLTAAGHTVTTLVRRAPRSSSEFRWSPADGTIDAAAIESADAVVNLAGATTGRIPWTPGYKREILYSRVSGARTIADAIAAASVPPKVFLSGSAVGFYGDRPGATLTETSPKGSGFLADVVEAWEQAARLTPPTTRTVMLRTGVVVGRGGAFTPLLPLTKLGLGARFGPGTQNWPWIALYDEAAAIRHLLTSTLDGVVNLTGPVPATSRDITHSLAQTIGRWDPWVVPTFAIKLLGDAGSDQLLASQLVAPERLLADGFVFRYDTVGAAIEASFGN
jgi:uncharacterized protein (TIGR01777 family)